MKKDYQYALSLGGLYLAVAGLLYYNWHEEQKIPPDTSSTSQPDARKSHLSAAFPKFAEASRELGVGLTKPAPSRQPAKNEWVEIHHLGDCQNLPTNWRKSLIASFGKAPDIWGRVETATPSQSVTISLRSIGDAFRLQAVHVTMIEFNATYFADKPWYKVFRSSELDVKSRYTLGFLCESKPR